MEYNSSLYLVIINDCYFGKHKHLNWLTLRRCDCVKRSSGNSSIATMMETKEMYFYETLCKKKHMKIRFYNKASLVDNLIWHKLWKKKEDFFYSKPYERVDMMI